MPRRCKPLRGGYFFALACAAASSATRWHVSLGATTAPVPPFLAATCFERIGPAAPFSGGSGVAFSGGVFTRVQCCVWHRGHTRQPSRSSVFSSATLMVAPYSLPFCEL